MRHNFPLSVVLLACTFFLSHAAATDGQKVAYYCNFTSPCEACSPTSRSDSSCSVNSYHRRVACTAWSEDEYPYPYDVTPYDDMESLEIKVGDRLDDFIVCDEPHHWSLLSFEVGMLVVLTAAMLIIRWRERIPRLS
jgi:hypothetical protein